MASPLLLAKRIPWMRLWIAAGWLYNQGRRRLEQNLTERERAELLNLMTKSKGRRANLTQRQQTRFSNLVRQAVTGRKP